MSYPLSKGNYTNQHWLIKYNLWLRVCFDNFLFIYSSKARPNAERSLQLGWQKKSEQKKRYHDSTTTSTANFVPGQTIHFLVEVFAFLSLFQPPKTFSYVFHFHNLSKRHSEKTIFSKKFFWKKKNQKKYYSFFFFDFFFFEFFFFDFFFFVQNLLDTFFFLFYCNSFSSNKKKRSKKRFARPVHFNVIIVQKIEALPTPDTPSTIQNVEPVSQKTNSRKRTFGSMTRRAVTIFKICKEFFQT